MGFNLSYVASRLVAEMSDELFLRKVTTKLEDKMSVIFLFQLQLNHVFSQFGSSTHISSVQSLSPARLFETPQTVACQASLSITNSWSLLKLISIEPVMPFNHLILCRPLLLSPSIFPRIRVFSNESQLQVAKVLEFQLQHQSIQ